MCAQKRKEESETELIDLSVADFSSLDLACILSLCFTHFVHDLNRPHRCISHILLCFSTWYKSAPAQFFW
jgi:hypothetical protein